jgi:hypothetical protein
LPNQITANAAGPTEVANTITATAPANERKEEPQDRVEDWRNMKASFNRNLLAKVISSLKSGGVALQKDFNDGELRYACNIAGGVRQRASAAGLSQRRQRLLTTHYSTETISLLKPRSTLCTLRTSSSIWNRFTRVAKARKMAAISSFAKCWPTHMCGPQPKASCSTELRVTSNVFGLGNFRSSRFVASRL